MSDTSFEKIVAEIEEQLVDEQQILQELDERLTKVRARVRQLTQAKNALTGEKAVATAGKKRKRPNDPTWTPKPESVQAVLVTLSESPEPMTVREIEQKTGRSHSHIDSVVRYLRRQELVRLHGKRGMASLYTTMPNSGLKETEETSAAYAA